MHDTECNYYKVITIAIVLTPELGETRSERCKKNTQLWHTNIRQIQYHTKDNANNAYRIPRAAEIGQILCKKCSFKDSINFKYVFIHIHTFVSWSWTLLYSSSLKKKQFSSTIGEDLANTGHIQAARVIYTSIMHTR